jgi:type IV fimbrial biogenesis protein FimT
MTRATIPTQTKAEGFTLIELLTTVVILGIIAGLAGPSFYSLIVGQQVRSASFDLSSTLVYTRDEATKRNANVRIIALASDWNSGWQVLNASGNVLQNQSAPTKVTITSNAATSGACATPCVVFNSTGRIATSNATTDGNPPSFKLVNQSGTPGSVTRCVLLDSSGRISTSAPSC